MDGGGRKRKFELVLHRECKMVLWTNKTGFQEKVIEDIFTTVNTFIKVNTLLFTYIVRSL
jgi:hypothetical protein